MGNNKLVDITGLSRYHEKLKGLLNEKQDVIEDLDAIRSNAAAGADALDAAKSYADSLSSNYDAAGAAAAAEAAAIADAAAKYQVKGEYEAAGAADAALTEAKSYVDGKVDGKFDEAGAAAAAEKNAKDYADGKFQVAGNYETAGAAAQALADAKADAASLYQVKGEYETAGAAAEALEAAKGYVDGKVDGKFDAAGAAAQALADAKADAASLYQVKGDYEVAGTAAGLNDAMDLRVKALEAIDHEKLATDASAAAVATVLDGAPEKFDTLKEVAEWISASDSAASAADLVTRVGALEAIDHDAYVNADAALKSELEGKIAKKVDAVDGSRLITDAEGTKLDGIEEGAQVNVIESLEVNGVAATIEGKKATVTVDCYTKNEINTIIEENERVTAGALTDLDSRVNELVGDTYNKSEIDTMIENAIVLASNDDIDLLFN